MSAENSQNLNKRGFAKLPRVVRLGLPILILGGLLAWYFAPKSGDEIEFQTERVFRGDLTKQVTANGEVAAVQLVSVGAQVSGQIKKLYVKLGQEVSKGDPIAEIDSVPQMNLLNIDKAKLDSYKAQLVAKKISLKTAQSQFNRIKTLRGKDAASKEAYEAAEDALALAKAEVTQLESQIIQTQIAVDTDTTNLGYTHIVSPLNGTVVSVPVDEGQTVNANQTTPTIVQVADLTLMEIKIEISEGDIGLVKPGIPISYTILSEPDKTYTATLTSIDPGLTTLTNDTYKSSSSSSSSSAVYFYGKSQIDNTDGPLRIGMTVQVVMDVATSENTLLAPIIGVKRDGKEKFALVLDKKKKKSRPIRKPVTTGISDGVHIEILSGLEEGDEVVIGTLTKKEKEAELNTRPGPRRR